MSPFDRHTNIALQFSGGKDSLATLYLLRPYWHRLTVYWLNSGAAFPETIALMSYVRKMVPSFQEILSSQPADLAGNGWPVDVLPVRHSPGMFLYSGEKTPKLQSFMECCLRNIMQPMHQRMIDDGITLIIRGQRLAETHKSPLRSGSVYRGFEFYFPIEDWSDTKVREFILSEHAPLPENYSKMNTSLDCWSCTAYMEESRGKLEYMRHHQPDLHRELSRRLVEIRAALQKEISYYG